MLTLNDKTCLPSYVEAVLSNNAGAAPCAVGRTWQSRGRWKTRPCLERQVGLESADMNGSVFFVMMPRVNVGMECGSSAAVFEFDLARRSSKFGGLIK